MTVTVQIPDDLARRLTAEGGDLSRRALEALAAEEDKRDRLTRARRAELLDQDLTYTASQLDGVTEMQS